jgi:uncharacterized protein YdaU (DUF1376 family)
MTARPIWMPLYVRDYLADTRHLKTVEHGAYLLLIMEYWLKGRLPPDDDHLRTICGLSGRDWRRYKNRLAALFGPGWRHERIEQELQKANDLRLKRQVYGSHGGRISRGRNNAERFNVVRFDPTKS